MASLTIRHFAGELPRGASEAVVVGVDVIRATTTAITAVAAGRRCFVAATLESALEAKARHAPALLAGELGGNMPYGFDLQNSPTALAAQPAPELPAILLSTSGTGMLVAAGARANGSNGHAPGATPPTMVACLRNWQAQARELLAMRPEAVVLLGAESRGEFREEDRLCCAWIGAALLDGGYGADAETERLVGEWRDAPVERIAEGKSAAYLRDSGQGADLDFILGHVADLEATYELLGDEVVARSLRAA